MFPICLVHISEMCAGQIGNTDIFIPDIFIFVYFISAAASFPRRALRERYPCGGRVLARGVPERGPLTERRVV